jgi:hypothetical protein
MPAAPRRLPVSSRRAFASAVDLAVRRDPIQSLLIPFLLRAPWALTLALLPPADSTDDPSVILGVASVALVGDFLTMIVLGSMLRFRARSVFNTPPGIRPAPAWDCYAKGIGRVPRLFLTEVFRNVLLGIAASFSILPAARVRLFSMHTFMRDVSENFLLLVVAVCLLVPTIFLGFRLAVATEAVVLDERTMVGAIQRSFRMMEGRFERWLELLATTAGLVIWLALLATLLSVLSPLPDSVVVAVFWGMMIVVTPVIQYAWTFFYLRLVEVESPLDEAPPMYAGLPAPEPLAAPASPDPAPQEAPPQPVPDSERA